MKNTLSLCPLCKKIIPAEITAAEQIIMHKSCPEHGEFAGVVEVSPEWYAACQLYNDLHVYDGIMIDVTGACNLQCRYCYHDNSGEHLPTVDIMTKIATNRELYPVILTGGEPTLHPDIIQILAAAAETGPFWLLTNGVRLTEEDFFTAALPFLLNPHGVLQVGLSLHPESNGADFALLDLCRRLGYRIGTVFQVIDRLDQVDSALATYDEYADVIESFRIKAASNLGQETGATEKIYTSQIVNAVAAYGGIIDRRYSNKVSYASMLLDGREVKCISWYDLTNVDLVDIAGPPYYTAKDGQVYNLVTTCLLDGVAP